MTMHNSKGLSAQIVFIPGLEEKVFPGVWRRSYPGLILEAARLLYVSMTRARAAYILSQVKHRTL
jgi:DNA helicase-2/ATP-dependent DNA helicase PcrA